MSRATPIPFVADDHVPVRESLELLIRCAGRQPETVALAREFPAHGDVPTTVQARKARAVEFLTKPLDGEIRLSAIRHAIERSKTALRDAAERCTPRQCYASRRGRAREGMALAVSGLLNKQFGGDPGLGEITVQAHRDAPPRRRPHPQMAGPSYLRPIDSSPRFWLNR